MVACVIIPRFCDVKEEEEEEGGDEEEKRSEESGASCKV